MSSTNKTTNYELSQFLGSDKPAWLVDYNGDMQKIDTQMKANAEAAAAAQTKANTADGKADANATAIQTLDGEINGATGLASDVATLAGGLNTVTSLIGNGEPTTTDKTLIGAINELDADKADDSKVGDLTTLKTVIKSSIVAAINEIMDDLFVGSREEIDLGTYAPVTAYKSYALKSGNTVTLAFAGLGNLTDQQTNVVGTLSEAYRPSVTIVQDYEISGEVYRFTLYETGEINVYPYSGVTYAQNVRTHITYVIDNPA